LSGITKKNIDQALKFVYSDNNSLSVIFHDNDLLMGVVGEFNKNLQELEKIILCDVAIKLGIISRNHKIEYNCRLLSVEKSKPNFKKLSRLSNLKSKQLIWEFSREVIK